MATTRKSGQSNTAKTAKARTTTPQQASDVPQIPKRAKRRAAGKAMRRESFLYDSQIRRKVPKGSLVTVNQLAQAFGLNAKTVRGKMRASELIGNDGTYTRYGFDSRSAEYKVFVEWLTATFNVKPNAVRVKAVK